MDVGIIGGTGPLGSALGARLAETGRTVVLGSRNPERAQETVSRLGDRWPQVADGLVGGGNELAARSDLVVVAVPWESVVPIAAEFADALAAKTVLCVANALVRVGSEFAALAPPRGSVAQLLQSMLPRSMVVAALHHVPARDLGELGHPLNADTMVASDFQSSAGVVTELLESIDGLRALYVGSLAAAGALEAMTAVLLNVNLRYRARSSLRVVGIREDDGR